MTDPKHLLVIVGITGNQGGSVADTFLTDPNLRTQYRLRGLTRDPNAAKSLALSARGVEMVHADLHAPETLVAAFRDAHTIFHARAAQRSLSTGAYAYELEMEQGVNVARAAAWLLLSGLQRFVVSTTYSPRVQTNGKYTGIWHFDAKGDFVAWVRREMPALAARMSCLNMGVFFRAWRFGTVTAPNAGEAGEWVLRMPCDPGRRVPFVDPNNDTGCFVRALVRMPPGVHVLGECGMLSWGEWLELWGKVIGKRVRFERCSVDFYEEWFGGHGYPKGCGRELGEMFEFMGDWGYDGSDSSCKRKEELDVEVTGLSSVEEYIRNEDLSLVDV